MRIAVTRLEEKSEGTPELFARYGHEAVMVPTMRTAPVDDTTSLDHLCAIVSRGDVDYLIFSSTMGVKYYFELCSGAPGGTVMIAVGPRTAEALKKKGQSCETIPRFSSDHFASHLGQRIWGRTVGIVRPDVPNPGLVGSLTSLGARVVEGIAYRLLPAGIDFSSALKNVDAVLFTSGKSFTLARISECDVENIIVMAIGPKTAAVMRESGVGPDITGNGTLESCLDGLSHQSR